ncbi:MAG TPA: MFS transporter [Thermomicrobiales bacterium]|nr:MFS transporter [Thermomicrobiales bacterium]
MSAASTMLPTPTVNRLPFLALFTANAVSLVGNGITALAIPWFVLQTTGSASQMGITAAAGLIPYILVSVLGGTAVDRLGHKRASVAADLASGLTVAAIPLLYQTVGLPFWTLLLLVFLGALLDAPGNAARTSLVPDLAALGRIPLERANGASQATSSLAALIGPALAGVLIAALGTSTVLWIDAGTFAFSALAVALAVPSGVRLAGEERGRYLDEVREGWRLLWSDRLLRAITLTAAVANAVGAPLVTVILPVYAERAFADVQALGTMVATFGGGSLAGAVLYSIAGHRLPRRRTQAAAFTLVALPHWLLIVQPSVAVATGALLVIGIGAGIVNPLIMTVFQERVPAEYRARVFGAVLAVAMIAAPLGVLVAGPLIEAVGLTSVIAGIAGLMLLVALSTAVNPAFHEMEATPMLQRQDITEVGL